MKKYLIKTLCFMSLSSIVSTMNNTPNADPHRRLSISTARLRQRCSIVEANAPSFCTIPPTANLNTSMLTLQPSDLMASANSSTTDETISTTPSNSMSSSSIRRDSNDMHHSPSSKKKFQESMQKVISKMKSTPRRVSFSTSEQDQRSEGTTTPSNTTLHDDTTQPESHNTNTTGQMSHSSTETINQQSSISPYLTNFVISATTASAVSLSYWYLLTRHDQSLPNTSITTQHPRRFITGLEIPMIAGASSSLAKTLITVGGTLAILITIRSMAKGLNGWLHAGCKSAQALQREEFNTLLENHKRDTTRRIDEHEFKCNENIRKLTFNTEQHIGTLQETMLENFTDISDAFEDIAEVIAKNPTTPALASNEERSRVASIFNQTAHTLDENISRQQARGVHFEQPAPIMQPREEKTSCNNCC